MIFFIIVIQFSWSSGFIPRRNFLDSESLLLYFYQKKKLSLIWKFLKGGQYYLVFFIRHRNEEYLLQNFEPLFHKSKKATAPCLSTLFSYALNILQTRCSWGCSMNTFVINSLIHSFTTSYFVEISSKHHNSQIITDRDLNFGYNFPHLLCVM